jgi:dephospho-CoA kinase
MTVVPLSGCVIVTGMPGAGKSTVSTLVARLLPRSARVSGDDVNEMILSGRVWFAAIQRRSRRRP